MGEKRKERENDSRESAAGIQGDGNKDGLVHPRGQFTRAKWVINVIMAEL